MYEKAIQLNPEDPDYYFSKGQTFNYYLGNSLYILYEYEEAIKMYDKAIKLNPSISKYYNIKGQRYLFNIESSLDNL